MTIRSEIFDDIYFSPENGLAETEHVFLEGNNLPSAWAGKDDFTIVETGFGTGLNFLVCWRLFEEKAGKEQRLDYISFEKHPLSADQIKETLSLFGDKLGDRLYELVDQYPLRVPGFHRIIFNKQIRLTIIFDDVNNALPELIVPGSVDAWFLDGFAPSKNPEMWNENIYKEMARLSRQGTTFATFTVAGAVRRGLQAEGFSAEKAPGFGRKKEMLMGQFSCDNKKTMMPVIKREKSSNIAIIGGGLAGSACAYILKKHGFTPVIYEKNINICSDAPANSIGLYNPRIAAHKTVESDYYTASFAQAVRTLGKIDDIDLIKCGYIHMVTDEKRAARYKETSENWGWHKDHMQYLSAAAASDAAGIKLDGSALYLPDSGCVSFVRLHEAFLDGVKINLGAEINSAEDVEEDIVIIACYGAIRAGIGNMGWLPIHTVRGQGTFICQTEATMSLKTGIGYGGHITPALSGLHSVGSTYQKWLNHVEILEEDHEFNLNRLRTKIPSIATEEIKVAGGRAGLRTATIDRFPVVGPVPDIDEWRKGKEGPDADISGMYVTTAHGSHGIVSTIASANLLADYISARPYGLGSSVATLLRPDRFLKRKKRKNLL
jgi:tRNA 5-methylaminomethyl-2-thiouridine biosynthesis bifunctional protein